MLGHWWEITSHCFYSGVIFYPGPNTDDGLGNLYICKGAPEEKQENRKHTAHSYIGKTITEGRLFLRHTFDRIYRTNIYVFRVVGNCDAILEKRRSNERLFTAFEQQLSNTLKAVKKLSKYCVSKMFCGAQEMLLKARRNMLKWRNFCDILNEKSTGFPRGNVSESVETSYLKFSLNSNSLYLIL